MGAASAATAVSGGMVAGEGQTVVTGDSSASVHVTNVINADNEGATSHTEVTKTVDGVTTKEISDQTYAPQEPVIVQTVVEAHSGAATAATVIVPSTGEITEEVATGTPQESTENSQGIVGFISQLFHSVLDILFW